MMSLEEVGAIALGFPGVTDGERYGGRTWEVGKKVFAWERPFSKADIKRFGDETPPDGPILAVRVEDLEEKAAVLEASHKGFFTIPHFDNYAAVLIQLNNAGKKPVSEAIEDAWLAMAPSKLAKTYLEKQGD